MRLQSVYRRRTAQGLAPSELTGATIFTYNENHTFHDMLATTRGTIDSNVSMVESISEKQSKKIINKIINT